MLVYIIIRKYLYILQANRSNAFQNRTDTLRIDAAELETLIQNGENDRKETDNIVSKDCFPNSERFMQTQTVFQGVSRILLH